MDYLEHDKLPSGGDEAAMKVKKWFTSQYNKYVSLLCRYAAESEDWMQALAVRTVVEVL